MAKKTTTKKTTTDEQELEAPKVPKDIRKPGDSQRMLSAEEVEQGKREGWLK